nr:hypothetical protein [Neolewinella aurantiaca]
MNPTPQHLARIDAYWRAANYLSVGQMYLRQNPLLRRPLQAPDLKPVLLGHWGTAPGQNFIYVYLNEIIKRHELEMIYISGPGHAGQAMISCAYLEGTYSEVYPSCSQDEEGMERLCARFSFPGGVSSHVSPECPGSIHEGGELGYSLSHAFGAAFDNPELIVACVIGAQVQRLFSGTFYREGSVSSGEIFNPPSLGLPNLRTSPHTAASAAST